MPPSGGKSKSKVRDSRQSRSRNTTPSSIASVPLSVAGQPNTAYLDIPIVKLMVPSTVSYEEILEPCGGGGGILDPKNLMNMGYELGYLGQVAVTRGESCDGALRELSTKQKGRIAEREAERAKREGEEKESSKRAAEDDDEGRGRKGMKFKKMKKERSSVREERPMAHGAHGLARQDGGGPSVKGMSDSLRYGKSIIPI